jgi:hypothetical protein
MEQFSNREILDIDSILGITRDAPVQSTIPQREIPSEIPQALGKRKRAAAPRSEAQKAKHRESVRQYTRKPEVRAQRKAKNEAKKANETEEEKEKVRCHRNGLCN